MTHIEVSIRTVDHWRETRYFKTLRGAQAFAQRYVGERPELGRSYAASSDGVAVCSVYGDATLRDLFPALGH